jgi:ATP synthase protein I
MDRRIRVQPIDQLIKVQAVLLTLIVMFFLTFQSGSDAIAALFGGLIVIANTLLQRWHLVSAATSAKSDASLNLRKAYRCVFERWLLTIVLFVVAFMVLSLSAFPLLVSFIITQFALLIGNINRA